MTASGFRLIAVLLLTVILIEACGENLSTEQRIIANLEQMESAAEEGRHLDFMRYVSDDFGGQYGSMDRREFHRFMIFQINKNRRLHASFFPIHVRENTSSGDETTAATGASAQFRILVTGGAGLLPDRGQLFAVKTGWVMDDGDWLLVKADWETVQMSE